MADHKTDLIHDLHASQAKHVYFMLAAAGSCIAFAIHRTSDAVLDILLVPWGIAVAAWALSIFAGIQNRLRSMSSTRVNVVQIELQRNILHREGDLTPFQDGLKKANAEMERKQWWGSFYFDFQLWAFYVGAIAFIAWHVWTIVAKG